MIIVDKILHHSNTFNQPHKFMYHRLLVARLYVTLSICLSVLSYIFEPLSKQGSSNIATNTPLIWICGAVILCLLAVTDIIINDLFPENFKLNITYDYRHIMYMFFAVLSFSISVAVFNTYGSSFLMLRLWLDGGIAAIVAFLDIFGRYKGLRDTTIHIHSK